MKLHTKVFIATQQWPTTAWASALAMGAHPNVVLFKFTTSKDCHVALRGHKGLVGTKLGLDEDFMSAQQVHKLEMWPLFKEAKATCKRAFWHAIELFIDGIKICPPSSV
ncbi:unnamed protein product [Sphagnum troendelagicum]|jgi:hypothetical protein